MHTSPLPESPAETTTDSVLVTRATGGDQQAFTTIMRRHNQRLFRTARAILKADAEAEEAVQEGYIKAWRALPGFKGQSTLSTWLVRIIANEALGRLRRTRAEVIPLEAAMTSPDPDIRAALADTPDDRPEQALMRAQMRSLMESRIDRLPDAYRAVFMLRAVEEMQVEEVAEALQIPAATVRTRLFRARSLLREGLASELDVALGEAFSFDGARCDRIVARVLARIGAEGEPS